jgi:hypothetical protein
MVLLARYLRAVRTRYDRELCTVRENASAGSTSETPFAQDLDLGIDTGSCGS